MKKLYLVRHAKSSWDNPNLDDHERPLNSRGKRDAPYMANLLKEKIELPNLIISSTAKRALSTAEIFAEIFFIKPDEFIRDKNLYNASSYELLSIINNLPNEFQRVMIFAHNPGLTMLTNHIGDNYIDNIPTCGMVEIHFEVNSWKEIEYNKGNIIKFEYPKKYLKNK